MIKKLINKFSIQSLIKIKKTIKKKQNLKKKFYFTNYKTNYIDSFINQYFKKGCYLKFYKYIKKNYNCNFLKDFKKKNLINNYSSYIIKNYKQVNDINRFFFFKFKKFSLNFYEKNNKIKILNNNKKSLIIFKYLILMLKLNKIPLKKKKISSLNNIITDDNMSYLNSIRLYFYKKQLISIKLTN